MILLNLLFILNSYSQTYFAGKSVEQIKELKKQATLKIIIRDEAKKESHISAGFIVSKEGRFITVNHDLRDHFLKSPDSKIIIIDSKGKEHKSIVIEGCSDSRNADVCTGKILDTKFKYYFEFSNRERNVGEIFSSVGHCGATDFTIKTGEVKKIVKDYQTEYSRSWDGENKKVRLLEVTNAKCVGDSGGPLFDAYNGAVIGMFSFGYENKVSKNIDQYFAIDSSELKSILENNVNSSLLVIPKSRINTSEACFNPKPGTREFDNCKDFN